MELSKNKLNLYSSLRSAKIRKKNRLFTVEGLKSVRDTIYAFQVEALITTGDVVTDFNTADYPVYTVDHQQMNKLSMLATPASVMAVYKMPEVKPRSSKLSDGLYVALDAVQDPGNLGTIIRTCHWFGIRQIFASADTVDIYNPKCIQSAMGSIASVNVEYCDLVELFGSNRNLPVYGTLLEGEDIFKADIEPHGFIVMGNEGNGVSDKVRNLIDRALFIPPGDPDNHSESLNVAIATAIVISQIVR